jgi:hypothetical protein
LIIFELFDVLGSILAGSLSGIGSVIGASMANNQARDIARDQMAFQERMSSTSYQRAMQDMRLAGLNPILASQVGGASSAPGAASPVSDVITPGVSSALQARQMSAELENIRKQNQKLDTEMLLNRNLASVALADVGLKNSTAAQVESAKDISDLKKLLISLQIPAARKSAAIDNSTFGSIMRYIDKASPAVNSAATLARSVSPFRPLEHLEKARETKRRNKIATSFLKKF